MSAEAIEIRLCTTLEEFTPCVELQRAAWHASDIDLAPREIFVVAREVGGHILSAFQNDRLVGFTMASPGVREGAAYLYCHMTAVAAEAASGETIMRRLKLAQREHALARGIDRIEWALDPFDLQAARFDLEELGAIAPRFARQHAGPQPGLLMDCLVVEWNLKAPEVEAALSGQRHPRPLQEPCVRVPVASADLRRSDPAEAQRLQAELARQFERWLGEGYAVAGLHLSSGTGTYLLTPHRS